jgi:hypothetical protein
MIKKYYVKEFEKNLMLKGNWVNIYDCDFFTIFKVMTPIELKLVYRTKKEPYLVIESICFDKNKLAIKNMVIDFNTSLCAEGINFKKVNLNI